MDEFDYDEEPNDVVDINKICSLLRVAWRIVPHLSFGKFLDEAVASNVYEVTGEELEGLLEEFIHQNQ